MIFTPRCLLRSFPLFAELLAGPASVNRCVFVHDSEAGSRSAYHIFQTS